MSYTGGKCTECQAIVIDSNSRRVVECPMCFSPVVRVRTEPCPVGKACTSLDHDTRRGDHVIEENDAIQDQQPS